MYVLSVCALGLLSKPKSENNRGDLREQFAPGDGTTFLVQMSSLTYSNGLRASTDLTPKPLHLISMHGRPAKKVAYCLCRAIPTPLHGHHHRFRRLPPFCRDTNANAKAKADANTNTMPMPVRSPQSKPMESISWVPKTTVANNMF